MAQATASLTFWLVNLVGSRGDGLIFMLNVGCCSVSELMVKASISEWIVTGSLL